MIDKKKPKVKPQRERLIETAKELEADETGEAFSKVYAKISSRKNQKTITYIISSA